jgi:hypothetical protein
MMNKTFRVILSAGFLLFSAATMELIHAQDKISGKRSLHVKLNYTGSGRVDEKHKIWVFLFDSADFVGGGTAPIATKAAASKDGTVTFNNVAKSPVYVGAFYHPSGRYDGTWGPDGSSMGMYSKTQDQPAPVIIEKGKTVSIDLPFDDSEKMLKLE